MDANGKAEGDKGTKPKNYYRRYIRPFLVWLGGEVRGSPFDFITAVATCGLMAFAYEAWVESTKGTRALESQVKAMQTDQRPFIGLTNDLQQPVFHLNPSAEVGQVTWN